ncbi:MAG: RHS repeat-associated core domain-containing protein [Kouleothrix sp.]|nr:RHS repeat-associated core domain-containing protein [Kouleothrix sp.]
MASDAAANGTPQTFTPWGTIKRGGISATSLNFTGQRLDSGTGLLYYHARYYDPVLGRFVSADSVVPGSASGGMDGVQLRPLTVDFHEPGFLGQIASENRGNDDKLNTMGLQNPQALNRYSYTQNNPLRWIDSTGHWTASVCLCFSGDVVFGGGSVGFELSFDGEGNIGVGYSWDTVATTAAAGAGVSLDIGYSPDEPEIGAMGTSIVTGGSVDVGVAIGADYEKYKASETTAYNKVSLSVGVGIKASFFPGLPVPIPAEGHVGASGGNPVASINPRRAYETFEREGRNAFKRMAPSNLWPSDW